MHQSPSLFKKSPGLQTHGLLHASLDKIKACANFFIAVSNIVSECVIMHAKASLFHNDLCSSKSFHIPSECTIHRPCFQNYLCNSKYGQKAPFTVLVFKISRRLPSSSCFPLFWYKICIIFLIEVSNIVQKSVKRQALATLF